MISETNQAIDKEATEVKCWNCDVVRLPSSA